MGRKCVTYGCGKNASHALPGEKPRHCSPHKEKGEINVVSKRCQVPGCPKLPSFGPHGEKPVRCSPHKHEGDINLTLKKCKVPGCPCFPYFGKPGEPPRRCANHKLEGDINVSSKRCEVPLCMKHPLFAQPGETSKRCFSHKIPGDINVRSKRCEYPGCLVQACFSQPGESPQRCLGHIMEGDINVKNRICEVSGCNTVPYFAYPDNPASRCNSHRLDNDVDVVSRRCTSEACTTYENIYDRGRATYINPESGLTELCYSCHRSMYPKMHTRSTVSKEQFILAEIQRQIPELEPYFISWDCAIPNQNCSRDKPDMVWGVNETLIHVEVDENGRTHEDDTERIVAIHSASNLSNHILIRFNPDKTSDGEQPCLKKTRLHNGDRAYIRYMPEWERRIPILVNSVRNSFNEAIENLNVTTGKRKLFF